VTLRDAIDAVLGDLGTDPATVLDQHGFGDLPPDTLSSALVHFAERAPIDVADALAPTVTRLSPVPFELDDLHPSDADGVLDDGGDVFNLLSQVSLGDVHHAGDADPSGFDHDHDNLGDGRPFGSGGEVDDQGQPVTVEALHHDPDGDPLDNQQAEGSFGIGHDPLDGDPFDENDFDPFRDGDEFDEDAGALVSAQSPVYDGTFEDPYDSTADGVNNPLDGPNDEPVEPLHEGLEDLASSMSDINHELDQLGHGHIDLNPG
jgi:hypothetical protein